MKQSKSNAAMLTKNMMIVDLMKQTGWSRERVVNALNFMELEKEIIFTHRGDFKQLKEIG